MSDERCEHEFDEMGICAHCGDLEPEDYNPEARGYYAALRKLARMDLPPAARAIVEEALR